MLREARLKRIKSYISPSNGNQSAGILNKFCCELVDEVERLRAELKAIADGQPTRCPASTGQDDLDMAYNLQATAIAALKEPDLGQPDFICQRFNVLDKEDAAQ